MDLTLVIITGMLVLSIAAPFIALYAVSFAKGKNYKRHRKIHKKLFWTCIVALVILELHIRASGGSGSLVSGSEYAQTTFFRVLLIAHILGAVLTYVIWGLTVFVSNKNFKKHKTLPGAFSVSHKKLGYAIIIGLCYTALTALMVCILAFFV